MGLGNNVLSNLLYFIDCDAENLYIGEGLAFDTLVTVNKVIAKRWKDCQIWDVYDSVILR